MACDYIALANPSVQQLRPYLPGKPAEELERELGLKDVVKLASNENPLGPSAKVVQAIKQKLAGVSRYPDSGGYHLKQALSDRFKLEPEQITLGNGSNDVLELIARAYIKPADEVIYSEFAFIVYPLVTQAIGAKAVVTPAKNWGHDLDAMLEAITDKTRLIFIANPNNPTGTWLNAKALQNFLDQVPESVLVVLDEAYTEYVQKSEFVSGLQWLDRYKNLIVTRTFSKAFGLAGLRVGYAVSNPEVADVLSRIRQPFNVNNLALLAAEVALNDSEHLQQSVRLNTEGLCYFEQELRYSGLEYIPSVANFVCVDVGREAAAVYERLLQQGVIVRPVANYAMPNHLRISIGLKQENQRCIEALKNVVVNF